MCPFPLYFPTAINKQTHNSLSSCCCTLFVTVTVNREPDASLSHSKILNQIRNSHSLLYRHRLRTLSFIEKFWIPNIYKIKKLFLCHRSSETGGNLQHSYVRNFIHHIHYWVCGHRILNVE